MLQLISVSCQASSGRVEGVNRGVAEETVLLEKEEVPASSRDNKSC